MKKAFILMLTLVFALAVSAQTSVGPKKGTALKATPYMKAMTLTPAKNAKTVRAPQYHKFTKGMTVKKDGKYVALSPLMKMARPAKTKTMSKALRKAEGKTVDLNITGFYQFTHYEGDDDIPTGDWFFGGMDETGNYFVHLDYLKNEENKYGTVTLDDMDADYSYIEDNTGDETAEIYFVEGTTFTVSQKDDHDVIDGTLVCDNGVTYNLHVDHTPETYTIESTDLSDISFDSDFNEWYIVFQDNKFQVGLDLLSSDGSFSGTYTEENAEMEYCNVNELETFNAEKFTTLNVTLSMPEGVTDPREACEITGTALGENGNTYIFHLTNGDITPEDSVEIEVEEKTIEWPSPKGNGMSYFEVTEKNNPQIQWNLGIDKTIGEANENYIIRSLTGRINTATNDTLTYDHGTVTQSYDIDSSVLHVAADVTMSNGVNYRFAFDHQVETKGDVAYNFHNLTVNNTYWGWFGIQWLDASNDDVKFEMTLIDEVPGEYNNDNSYARLYYPNEDGTETEIDGVTIFNAASTLDDDNRPVLNCKFLGSDMIVYTINADFVVPEVQDTIDVDIDGLRVDDLIESMDAFQIRGYNSDETMYASIAAAATQIPGHYTYADLDEYRDYCFIAFIDEENGDEKDMIYQADFDVTQNGRDVTLTGQFQAGVHWVNMTLKGRIHIDGLDYDVEEEDLDVNFEPEDLSELVKYEDSGYAYVRLQNSERNDCFAMLIYLDKFDDVTMFPEGTYDINGTYGINSVQQGSITSDLATVYPTFYATCTDDGYLNLPLWLFRSGTVTIMKDVNGELAFEINAMNSYKCNCHVTYNLKATGIKNVDTDNSASVRKMLDNHQVVIKKGDQKFTVVGQMLK